MPPRFLLPANLVKYRGFIFDCDGTLIDSMPLHFLAWKEALLAGGARFEFHWSEFLSRAGMSLEQTTMELSLKYGCVLNVEVIREAKGSAYARKTDQILPIDEVVAFARSIHGKFPMVIATGSRRPEVEEVLRRLELLPLFDEIITPEDVTRGKPAPDMFLLAAKKMQVEPEECLVLEDGESGFEAARRANMDFLVVSPSPAPTL